MTGGRPIPPDAALDRSLAFLREGYTFVSNRCSELKTDIFRTRIMLKPVICMKGAEAAEIFYSGGRFTRQGAMPKSVLHLLQDEGSVQSLDGPAHERRKQMFMRMMSPTALEEARKLFREEMLAALPRWARYERVVLHDAVSQVLTRAAARWAGVPLTDADARLRWEETTAMIDKAGSIGPANLWARSLRSRSERWARDTIESIRQHKIEVPDSSAAAEIALHRDRDGRPLDLRTAGVELLNVLRPTVAVGRYIVFAVLALLEHARWREMFAAGEEDDLEPFVQEIRRYYPFFPVIGGRTLREFEWRGYRFSKGDWVLLDLYGTNHDPRIWEDPNAFRPERFRHWQGNPFTLVPQGAGEFENDHRCPGEWLTIGLVKEAVRIFCREMRYTVPVQDMSISLSKMPTLPRSGFVISKVEPATSIT